jgi:Tol biopolymer transport system component
LEDVAARGVDFAPHEAVAVVQQLMFSLSRPDGIEPEPPFGPPTPHNVVIAADGRVRCRACAVTPVTSEIGALLGALLARCGRVPGALRYAVARATLEVDAPPYDSVHDFTRSLVRFERGNRRDVVAGVFRRAVPPRRLGSVIRRAVLPLAAAVMMALAFSLWLSGGARPVPPQRIVPEASIALPLPLAPKLRVPSVRRTPAPSPGVVRVFNQIAFSPSFATDGQAMLFHTGHTRDARSDLMWSAGNTASARLRPLVEDGARNYHPRLSPDGTTVAFDSDRDGERAVYVANLEDGSVQRLSGPGHATAPTWSPDGRRLAFVRAETGNPRVWNLWLRSLATGEERRLTRFRYGQTWAASWFPDGDRIAYSHEDRLAVLDLNTGRTRRFATPLAGRLVRTPAVSPDGRRIIFQVRRSGAWVLDVDTGRMTRVLNDPTAEEFAWAPDSRRVAFHSRRDGRWGIWIATL